MSDAHEIEKKRLICLVPRRRRVRVSVWRICCSIAKRCETRLYLCVSPRGKLQREIIGARSYTIKINAHDRDSCGNTRVPPLARAYKIAQARFATCT